MMGSFKDLNAEVTSGHGLKVFKMEALSEPMSLEPSQHRQELVDRLDILRTNESFCDVTIVAKGKEFKAHKAVLAAASPFFLTLLTSDMKESREQLIKIELEEATAAVMEDVLKYVYTGNVLMIEERAHNLFVTADYLLIPGLKAMAGNFLEEVVSIENCIFNYYFADKYQCLELREKSCEVINSHFSVVMETENFLNLGVKQVMEWVSSDDITVGAEEEVFKGIVKWVSHKKSEREEAFPELLYQVRLTSVSHDFLLNELIKEELITTDAKFGLNFVADAMKLVLNSINGQVTQQPRKCLDTHVDGIFVCGGRKALCYFPQQNLWYSLANKTFDHQINSLAHCRGRIYVGSINTGLSDSQVLEYYFPSTNSWGTVQRGTCKDMGNIISCMVLRGDLHATNSSGAFFRYDVETNCWNKVMDTPSTLTNSCLVTDEQYLYKVGGLMVGGCASSTTTRFDSNNHKCEEIADLNEARFNAFGATMNNKVYVAGGQRTWHIVLSSCEVYNPSTNEWQLMPSLNIPRFSASMVCFGEQLYVFGGLKINQLVKWSSPREITIEELGSEMKEWAEKSVIPVKSFESSEEKKKTEIRFQACSARLHKGVIDKLKPLY